MKPALDISSIARRLKKQYPSVYQAKDAQTMSLISYLVGPVKPALLTLLAAVGLVLLIVCVNIANLLLALDTKREKEFAVRGALGASWVRIGRQLFIECLLLSAIGGALGSALAYWAVQVLRIMAPANIPRIETVHFSGAAFCFTIAISLFSCLLFGCLPAWHAAKIDIQDSLKASAGHHTSGQRTGRAGRMLIISEIALAFMLLIGAGLLIRSFNRLQNQDLGFHASHVLTASLSFPVLSLDPNFTPPSLVPTYERILGRVNAIPGVQSAAFISQLPLVGPDANGHFSVEGRPDLPGVLSSAKLSRHQRELLSRAWHSACCRAAFSRHPTPRRAMASSSSTRTWRIACGRMKESWDTTSGSTVSIPKSVGLPSSAS